MNADYPILEFDGETDAIIEPSKVLKPVDGIPERLFWLSVEACVRL